jgi:hypothetical protein
MTETPESYVFWTYDLYPYMLGAKVKKFTKFSDKDAAIVEGYGPSTITYFARVDGEAGRNLLAEIKALREERDQVDARIKNEFKARLVGVLARYRVRHPTLAVPMVPDAAEVLRRMTTAETGCREFDFLAAYLAGMDWEVNDPKAPSFRKQMELKDLGDLLRYDDLAVAPYSTSIDAALPGENIVSVSRDGGQWVALHKEQTEANPRVVKGHGKTEALARRVAYLSFAVGNAETGTGVGLSVRPSAVEQAYIDGFRQSLWWTNHVSKNPEFIGLGDDEILVLMRANAELLDESTVRNQLTRALGYPKE